ncbi:23S rRNA (pseudouridine(1915)-N(3))-methyltransferase RlmH [Litoreibacter roseus]|uniref:Ribosomal RNA large subunit methyltransferase H n=1 Tax=Litoreibacter roseus TaxID=2601869 RepID=A0A6N6JH33_9RHOB|nr:23S rRNA (pseudouridine(1915)-N(3))-methyltransferase RlmH [Litoreibacter roseus]GFE64598.1 ribosomal RNA large subunit methyltransferase H [Litoreibacter roseus]
MRIHICAVGRLRSGPELDLIEDYLKRFDRTGRGLGLGPARIVEIEDKKSGGSEREGALLANAIPKGSLVCTLDERGDALTSPEFASKLANWRDAGRSDATFLIGGADGLSTKVRAQADFSMSFGKMVWPHMLARVMLSEQLYRAASIAANLPYHRI